MNRSEMINEVGAALAKAQNKIQTAKKDSLNPHFNSTFANLASVWEACREALTENGLSVVQTTTMEQGEIGVETMLLHSSGQWISGILPLRPEKNTPQGIGSAITYARRYALAAIVGVAPDDDDDGEAAEGRGTQRPAAASPTPRAAKPTVVNPLAKAREEKAAAEADPGDYVCKMPKFLNQKLRDIDSYELASYVAYWSNYARTKTVTGNAAELIKFGEAYLTQIENRKNNVIEGAGR